MPLPAPVTTAVRPCKVFIVPALYATAPAALKRDRPREAPGELGPDDDGVVV